MTRTFLRTLTVTAALALAPLAAQAFTVSYQNADKVFNTNGRAKAKLSSTAAPVISNLAVLAGGFALSGDLDGDGAAEHFTGWCLDILTTIKNGKDYVATSVPFNLAGDANARDLSDLQVTNIGKLFNTAYGSLARTDHAQSAAFQLALWEIVYETGDTFGLGTGTFTGTSGVANVISTADMFLAKLHQSAPKAWNLLFLQSQDGSDEDSLHDSQNLVTVTPVPLPAAGLLMLGALGGLGLMRRRKQPVATGASA